MPSFNSTINSHKETNCIPNFEYSRISTKNGKISGQSNPINLLKIFVFNERKSNGNEWRRKNWTCTTNFFSILSIFVQVVLLFLSIETLTDPNWMPYSVEEKTTIAQQPHHQLKWTCTKAVTDNSGYRSKRNRI